MAKKSIKKKIKIARSFKVPSNAKESSFQKIAKSIDPFGKFIVPMFFLVFIILGASIIDDYGISWDEEIERNHGLVSIDYANKKLGVELIEGVKSPVLWDTYKQKHYGVLFQAVCLKIETLLNIVNYREAFLLRHWAVFILFWLSCIFFFMTLKFRYLDWKIALMGTLFLILSPRIFADSFYNPKDLVFLSFYVISAYTLLRFLKKPNYLWALIHGFTSGLVINGRILGIIIPALTIGYLFIILIQSGNLKIELQKKILPVIIYIICTIVITFLFWPHLWEDPFGNLLASFNLMSKYNWNSEMLYWGQIINPEQLPWHYILSWILITTPILYTLLFVFGTGFILTQLFRAFRAKRFFVKEKHAYDLFYFGLFAIPLLYIILSQARIYHGWRHVYFLYPAFIYTAILGIYILFTSYSQKIIRIGIPVFVVISLLYTVNKMVQEHPYQYSYFNFIAGDELERRFDVDYWGVSLGDAIKEIAGRDNSPEITFTCAGFNFPCKSNWRFLPKDIRKRVRYLEDNIDHADYYVTNYLWTDYGRYMKEFHPFDRKEFLSIGFDNRKICSVYRLKTWQ